MTKTGLLVFGEVGAVSLTWNRLLFLFCFRLFLFSVASVFGSYVFVSAALFAMLIVFLRVLLPIFLPIFRSLSTLQRDDGLVGGVGILNGCEIYRWTTACYRQLMSL